VRAREVAVKRFRVFFWAVLLVAFSGAALTSATPAQAQPSASCRIGVSPADNCFYWGQSYDGSHAGVTEFVLDFPVTGTTEYQYLTPGAGQWWYLGNDNGSNRNGDTKCETAVYYNPNFSGPDVTLPMYPQSGYQRAGGELGTLLNNARSETWNCFDR